MGLRELEEANKEAVADKLKTAIDDLAGPLREKLNMAVASDAIRLAGELPPLQSCKPGAC